MPLLVLLLLAAPALAADINDFRLPLKGVVAPPKGGRLTVYDEPPDVGAFSYKRGTRICAIGAGTQFVASRQLNLITGELWLRIKADKPKNHNCKTAPVVGWIPARSGSDVLLIEVLAERPQIQQQALQQYMQQQQLIGSSDLLALLSESSGASDSTRATDPVPEATDEAPAATDPIPAATDEAEAAPAETEGETAAVEDTSVYSLDDTPEDEHDDAPNPVGDFLLVFIGSVMGTLVIAVERARSVHVADWYSPLLVFECAVLAVVNFIIAHTFVDELFSVGEVSAVFSILRAIYSAPGGFLLWGFVLSILLLKFISFDKGDAKPKEAQA